MSKEEMAALEEQKFEAKLRLIKANVTENWAGKTIEEHLNPLHVFFSGLQPGCNAKEGILLVLTLINNPVYFEAFIKIQESLIAMPLYCSQSSPAVSFFELLTLEPSRASSILIETMSLFHFLGDKAADAILFLATIGSQTLDVLSSDDAYKQQASFLFLSRLNNYSIFIRTTNQSFSSIGRFSFQPTTGDLHNGGQNPLICINGQETSVYKPRSLTVDLMVAACQAHFQNLLDKELQCPVCAPFQIYTPLQTSGFPLVVPFMTEENCLTVDNARNYFQKLGALLCFAKIYGIRDLHYENIMATIEGPVIIDAECAFNKQTITSLDFDCTEIGELFYAFTEKMLEHGTFFLKEGTTISLPDFKGLFLEAFIIACQKSKEHTEQLTAFYTKIIATSFSCRWVPIKTSELNGLIRTFLVLSSDSETRGNFISDTADRIIGSIVNTFEIEINTSIISSLIQERLIHDFTHGDIPIFSIYHPEAGICSLQMDGQSILNFPFYPFATPEEFAMNINNLFELSQSQDRLENLLGSFFH